MSAIEYAILVGVVAVSLAAGLSAFSDLISDFYGVLGNAIGNFV